MIRWFKSRLSMKRGACLFTDMVNNRPVYAWTDKYGDEWMAQSQWGFRMKRYA